MKNKLINELVYVALIVATLMCLACIDTDVLIDITNPQEDTPLPPGEGLAEGATAPAFLLPDADGNLLSLSNYAGQKLVIVFYATGT